MTVHLYKVSSWESELWDCKWVQLRGASGGWEGGRGARRQWSDRAIGREVQLRAWLVTLSSDPASLREPGKVVGSDGAMETLCTWASRGDGCGVPARSRALRGLLPALHLPAHSCASPQGTALHRCGSSLSCCKWRGPDLESELPGSIRKLGIAHESNLANSPGITVLPTPQSAVVLGGWC